MHSGKTLRDNQLPIFFRKLENVPKKLVQEASTPKYQEKLMRLTQILEKANYGKNKGCLMTLSAKERQNWRNDFNSDVKEIFPRTFTDLQE